jgi:CheY-like chemotaxis protein
MSTLWLIEDSPRQLHDLEALLKKMGHVVHAFRDPEELLAQIAELPAPEAIVVDLALKGTSNGFQAASQILKVRPTIEAHRFCFISGWKNQFNPLKPEEFKDAGIIDKGNWTLEDLKTALARATQNNGGG